MSDQYRALVDETFRVLEDLRAAAGCYCGAAAVPIKVGERVNHTDACYRAEILHRILEHERRGIGDPD